MSNAEESIDGMGKFNEKIYEDGITWLFGHHCLECGHLTFAQREVKELAKYFYELGYQQAEKDLHKSIYKAGVLDGFEDAVEGQYEKGYEQAEKDLELTWEDMALVCKIEFLICTEYKGGKLPQRELFYQEILKRFKDFKERKEK